MVKVALYNAESSVNIVGETSATVFISEPSVLHTMSTLLTIPLTVFTLHSSTNISPTICKLGAVTIVLWGAGTKKNKYAIISNRYSKNYPDLCMTHNNVLSSYTLHW